MVKISVISVVYNDRLGLKATIDSVKNQSYFNFEFIVVDGGSSDGTVDTIKENEESITKWVSEPDKGIYDAMNKGIDLASGDFAIFMNAGDVFYSKDTLSDCVKNFDNPNAVYFGRAENSSEEGHWFFPPMKINESNIITWLKKNVPNHQSMFFPRCYYKQNYYDLSLKISADADYKWKALKLINLDFIFLEYTISVFEIGGVSTTYESFAKYKARSLNAWIVGKRYHSFSFIIKYQIKLVLKFFIVKIFGQNILNKIIKIKY